MAENMRSEIASMLKGIERYNPDNVQKLERYVELQAKENTYDLEANLSVLRLYQFGPSLYRSDIVILILLKALTNLPHTDFVLCKCLLTQDHLEEPNIKYVMSLASLLETCNFKSFWEELSKSGSLLGPITGFEDSVRKFVSHVVNITFQTIEGTTLKELLGNVDDQVLKQWITKNGWKDEGDGSVFITSQEDLVKTKNITEKVEFENVAGIMAHCI
nr:EOG090X0BWZ [Cyclestheria hislopi]